MLCWNWSLPTAMEMERQFPTQEYVSLGAQPPGDRMEEVWRSRTCCFTVGLLFMFLALVVTGTYSVFHKNVQSYSLINTFSEHPIITGSTEFTDSKVNTSTDTLAITSSTDSKGETSSETALVTKKARKMHRERTTSTLGIPPSEVELIGMPPSVEILKTSDNILYDISTESYVKYKTKKRKLYNSLKNNFEEINVAETTTEGKRNLKSANRDPISHKILKEVWKTIQEYPSDANDKK